MPAEIRVYAHPDGPSWREIDQAVKNANGLQSVFRVSLVPWTEGLTSGEGKIGIEDLDAIMSRARPEVNGLVLLEQRPTTPRLVEEVLPKRIYATCAVRRGAKQPPFRLYLLYQIAAAALTLSAGLDPKTNEQMIHNPPVGCLWDWWSNDEERHFILITARLCRECRDTLMIQSELTDKHFAATQQILEYIRRAMLGESPEIANSVFLAYGHGQDWKTLRDLLQRWGLSVEHFNRAAPAGMPTVDRWKQMLNRSRFAFALMTPDDRMADNRMLARQNVVHEIGLCHSRLGLYNTAILLAKGTEIFSNIDGITRIDYDAGNLLGVEGEIRSLLEQRGLL